MRSYTNSSGKRLTNYMDASRVLEKAISYSWEAVFVLDSKARYRYINRASGSITGEEPDNWMGQPAGTRLHPDDGERAMAAFLKALQGENQSLDLLVQRPDGSYRTLEIDLLHLQVENEPHVLGMARDVTDHRESERKLREERDLGRKYLDVAAVIMLALNREDRVTLLNRKGEEVLGYTEDELKGKNWFETCIPADCQQEIKSLHQRLAAHQLKNGTVENPVVTRDGRTRIISWKNSILTDEAGNVTGTLSSGEDITENKRVEKRLGYHLGLEAALAKASQLLMSEEPDAPEKVLETIGLATGAKRAYIYGFNEDSFEMLHDWSAPGHVPKQDGVKTLQVNNFPWSMSKLLAGENVLMKDVSSLPSEAELEKAFMEEKNIGALLVFPFFGANGNIAGVIGFNDTSDRSEFAEEDEQALHILREMFSRYFERKKSREALEKNERLYRLLADSMVDVVWTMDMNLNMTYLSPSVEKLMGYTPEEYKKLSLEDYLTPDSQEKALQIFKEELSRQVRGEGGDRNRSRTFEMEQVTRDGNRVWVENLARFLWSEDGGLHGIHGVSREITDRKRAEDALQRSEAKFRALYDSTPDAVMLIDESGYFDCNPAALSMFGCERNDICSKRPAEMSPPLQPDGSDSLTKGNEIIRKVMREGCDRFEWVHRRQDTGEDFPAEVLLNRLELDGRKVVQAVIRDISGRKRMEEELKASEEKYRLLFENMNDIIYSLDADLKFLQVSPSVEKILGLSPENLIGKTLIESGVLAPEQHDKARANMQRVMAGENIEDEYEIIAADQSRRIVEINASPLFHGNTIIGSMGVARDVTGRRQEEAARKEAELRYLSLFRSSRDGVFVHDLEGRFLDANAAALEMTGYSREDIDKLNFAHLVSSDNELLKAIANVQQMLETGMQPEPMEITLRRKDGRDIDIETMGALIYKEDMPSYIIGFARDVTERNRMMRKLGNLSALLESEHSKLRSMLDNMRSSVIMADENNIVQDMNSSAEEFLDMPRNKVIGKSVFDFHHESKYPLIAEIINDLKKGEKQVVSLKRRLAGRWMDMRISPIRDNLGEYRGVILYMIDVHSLVEARQKAEEASRAKSRFLANMSHEIRTPLNGVLGFAELLQRSDLEPKRKKYVDTIITSGRHLLTLINQVLDLSRIEAGRTALDNRLFHPRSVVKEAMEMVRPQAENKGIRLVESISPQMPPTAEADEGKIIQVLTNLAGNAVKFTDRGKIEFIATTDDIGGGRLVFSVRDTGAGIPAEKQESVFKAFEQAESGLTREHEGTGLGLAISSRLVELMGGEITVESEPGKGSTFTFKVPLKSASERGDREKESPGDNGLPEPSPGQRTVLVIESDDKDREVITGMLSRLGINALEQPAPQEGLVSAQFYEPDAVILGGWKDGHAQELHKELSQDPVAGNIPVIAASIVDMDLVDDAKPDAWLNKPVREGCLARALRKAGIKTESSAVEAEQPCPEFEEYNETETGASPLILLVEDNPVNRQFVKEALNEKKWSVMEAENGRQCLDALENTRPELILMDLAMPVMDGLEATRRIKEDPRFKDIPVVALTAAAMEGDKEKCLQAGCDGYVAKPVKIDSLNKALQEVLYRKGE